ncbi:MAG: helicase-related protein [Acidimicrobiaceae bacterium]|nr:helicase-related protein [Acidimicrobiaceae bacterium]
MTRAPKFATNDPPRAYVSDAVNDLLAAGRSMHSNEALLSTPYFSPEGFRWIADELAEYPSVRLLLGSEPTATRDGRLPTLPSTSDRKALDVWMKAQADAAGQDYQRRQNAGRLVAWLRDQSRDVRVRMLRGQFLHGKAFIADHPAVPLALAGSSNLTHAGMRSNAELNLGVQQDDAARVVQWFKSVWGRAEDYKHDLLSIYLPLFEPCSPHEIWLRMLHACYVDAPEPPLPPGEELLWYQRSAVPRLWQMLNETGGALLADETGLGKTHVMGALARLALMEGGSVLVLCPAAIRKSVWERWKAGDSALQESPQLRRNFSVVSYEMFRSQVFKVVEEVTKQANQQPDSEPVPLAEIRHRLRREFDYSDCSLIICDEGHYLRSIGSQARLALRALMTVGEHRKRLLLGSATPINNALADLRNLLSLYMDRDDALSGAGVASWREQFAEAEAQLGGRAPKEPAHRGLSAESRAGLDRVLERSIVRRSRDAVIAAQPEGATITREDGEIVELRFPEPRLRPPTTWGMTDEQEDFVELLCEALDPRGEGDNCLWFPHYEPERFKREEPSDKGGSRVGLVRSLVLKRADSSPLSLVRTLLRLERVAGACIEHLDDEAEPRLLRVDDVFKGVKRARRRSHVDEDGDPLDALRQMLDEDEDADTPRQKADYLVNRMREDLAADREVLQRLLAHPWVDRFRPSGFAAQGGSDDETPHTANAADLRADLKVTALLDRLAEIARHNDANARKVLVFTEYADTAEYVRAAVAHAVDEQKRPDLARYAKRVAPAVTGGMDEDKRRIAERFAPLTMHPGNGTDNPRPDDYDVLVSTDVLAEGLNLQQAGKVINYDMPWNPTRVTQRIGRVDRLGSMHETVESENFYPDESRCEPDPTQPRWRVRNTLRWKLAVIEETLGAQAICPTLPGGSVRVLGAETLQEADAEVHLTGLDLRRAAWGDILAAQKHAEEHRAVLAAMEPAERARLAGWPAGVHCCYKVPDVTAPTFVFCAMTDSREAEVLAVRREQAAEGHLNLSPWTRSDELPQNRSLLLEQIKPALDEPQAGVSDADVKEALEAWAATRTRLAGHDTRAGAPATGRGMGAALEAIREMRQHLPEHRVTALEEAYRLPWSDEIVRGVRRTLRRCQEGGLGVRQRFERLEDYAHANRMIGQQAQPDASPRAGRAEPTLHSWLLLLPESDEDEASACRQAETAV